MKHLLVILALISGPLTNLQAEDYMGLVTRVIDGDSIEVKQKNTINKIRLSYIDAPEIRQEYGEQSKIFLKNLLLDKIVLVSTKDYKDRYGRYLAELYIHTDDEAIYINAKMIKSGNAWVYKSYRSNAYLINLEKHARINNMGLWNNNDQVEPWLYRKKYR